MRSSEQGLRERAQAVVARMAAHLQEAYLAARVDKPIDRAAQSFDYRGPRELSFRSFRAAVARFVAHIYAHGLSCPRELSPSQAEDEAITLLDSLYEGPRGRDFHAAFLDAVCSQPDGLTMVLARLTEGIKARAVDAHPVCRLLIL